MTTTQTLNALQAEYDQKQSEHELEKSQSCDRIGNTAASAGQIVGAIVGGVVGTVCAGPGGSVAGAKMGAKIGQCVGQAVKGASEIAKAKNENDSAQAVSAGLSTCAQLATHLVSPTGEATVAPE